MADAMDVEKLKEIVKDIADKPNPEWIMISPNGFLYQGTADQLIPIIAKDASIFNPDR